MPPNKHLDHLGDLYIKHTLQCTSVNYSIPHMNRHYTVVHYKRRTHGSDTDAVCELVISLNVLQTLVHCPGPQPRAVPGLIHIANGYMGK